MTSEAIAAPERPASRKPLRELLEFPLRCLKRFGEMNGKMKALALAGQAFMSVMPMLVLAASIGQSATNGSQLGRIVVNRFHLTGPAADAVHSLFARPPGAEGAVSLVSIVVLVFALLALAKTLQVTYEEAWGMRPSKGLRATLFSFSGMSVLIAEVILLMLLASLLGRLPGGGWIGLVPRIAAATAGWLVLQRLLLGAAVPWRELIPSSVVAAGGQTLCSLGSRVYLPHLISRDASRYGTVGVTIAVLSWFIVLGTAIVLAAIVGAELRHLIPGRMGRVRSSETAEAAAARPASGQGGEETAAFTSVG